MSSLAELEKRAAEIRSDLAVPKLNDVFAAAVKVRDIVAHAYVASAPREREALVRATGSLTQGVGAHAGE
jgi:hypothetical protein